MFWSNRFSTSRVEVPCWQDFSPVFKIYPDHEGV